MDLSIIIVNFNASNMLAECLKSINQHLKSISYEVIIVDNSSWDNSIDLAKKEMPDAKYILTKKNEGFSKANNHGIKIAKGSFVLFLNPDVLLTDSSLIDMVKYMQKNPEIGIMGPKLIMPNGKIDKACRRSFPTISSSFFKIIGLSKLFPKNRYLSKYNLGHLDYNKQADVEATVGAFILISQEALNKISGFDEDFFLYGEDIDLCKRVKEAGFRVVYYPKASAVHIKGGCTRPNLTPVKAFYKSMWIFYKKHYYDSHSFLVNCLVYCSIYSLLSLKIGFMIFKERLARIIQFIIAILLFTVTIPLFTVISALIRLESKGPAIYKQVRLGINGKPFIMYKFRTMQDKAEKNRPVFDITKIEDKITKFGKVLRASKMDELPQLINIIKGEMNFIGPRPERPMFVAEFQQEFPEYSRRLWLKPGITGWAQVHGYQGNTSIKGRLKYDIEYIQNKSLLINFKIIILTFKWIIKSTINYFK